MRCGRGISRWLIFVGSDAVGGSSSSGEEVDSDLALLNRTLICLLDLLPEGGKVGLGGVGHGNRLDQEFVAALCIEWRIFFHGLKQDW